jgi:alkane 1-monooxygenase
MKDLKYLLAYIVPVCAWIGIEKLGFWVWLTPIVIFGVIPVLDMAFPLATDNITSETEFDRSKIFFFDILLYLCPFICYFIAYHYFEIIKNQTLSMSELVGITLSTGLVIGSMGINVAHELGHRNNRFELFLSKLGLMINLYMHFTVEHNRGHHRLVSTPSDPATARKNESVYAFYIRSIFGQIIHAWQLEKERLTQLKKSVWNLENEMIQIVLIQSVYLIVVAYMFGISMIPFAIAIAVIGIILLETVNYIEHYGLVRKLLSSGEYERVMPMHSWNSDHFVGRIVLFELTRHSDHHYKATRKYQILRHLDESPQLPLGYPGSMLLSLIPPLWFQFMNKKIPQY